MSQVAICPYCLSSAIEPIKGPNTLRWFDPESADKPHMKCLECCNVFQQSKVLHVELYPDDACFSLTDQGRAALQEVQS